MQIEVTEIEAKSIYSQRYVSGVSRFKYQFLPLIIAGVAMLVSLFSMSYIGDWLGLLLFVVLLSPSGYLYWSLIRNSRNYAKKQIEGQK